MNMNSVEKLLQAVKGITNENYDYDKVCEVRNEILKDNWKEKTLSDIASNIGKFEELERLLKNDKESNEEKCNKNVNIIEALDKKTEKIIGLNIDEISYCGDILFLPKFGTLYVIGDTHGDAESVKRIIKRLDFSKKIYVVFLGDFVNNGLNGIDNLITVLKLEEQFPKNVVLLSGNHEFRETYYTVLNEFFITHWDNFMKNPTDKVPPNHYGHIRLELVTRFGFKQGEYIYDLFVKWGRRLPYVAFSAKGIMMSHSIGLAKNKNCISFDELAKAKKDPIDLEYIKNRGYEDWRKNCDTLHARMVNNNEITKSLLNIFQNCLGVNVFVVGHRHYRSGDIHKEGNMIWTDVKSQGRFVTISSSHEDSKDAGHYIEHEYEYTRSRKTDEQRQGRAKACYTIFREETVDKIDEYDNIRDV